MFNVHNSTKLITDLSQINIITDVQICSFDTRNMYSNVPTHELINIIIDVANKYEIHREIIKAIKLLTELIIKQNYFELN
jgi:hypothetical protein